MARRTYLHPHLRDTELSQGARRAPTRVEVRRGQLLALVGDGKSATDAAALSGHSASHGRVTDRYKRDGPESLRDHRLEAVPPRETPLPSADEQQELAAAIAGPALGGGLWTEQAVAR